MRFAVISDTHSNRFTEKAYNHMLSYKDKLGLDFVVFNGDLIGHFSLAKSSLHKGTQIPQETLYEYLKEAAPRFYDIWIDKQDIPKQLLLEYVGERYSWLCSFLEKSSQQIETIWNLGNHESKHHYLVLQELPFFTGCDPSIIQAVDTALLDKIYGFYEEKIETLDHMPSFHYIHHKPLIKDDTMIIGIPGESHGTVGKDPKSRIQEQKTKDIISQAKSDIENVSTVIVCNHTQGAYDRSTSSFQPASPSMKTFISEISSSKQVIWIQSHNHWSYTQFLERQGVDYILNNAGLHDGIYNIIDIGDGISVYDAYPRDDMIQRVNQSSEYGEHYQNERMKISRHYEDVAAILERKGRRS